MALGDSLLVCLVRIIDQLPMSITPDKRKRGRPPVYSDRLLLKALVVMIIPRLYTAWALLTFLQQADPVGYQLRVLLTEDGRSPSRRTWECRLQALPTTLSGLIGCFGRHLVVTLAGP